MDRITELKQFVKEDPDDPFNYYALALEYLRTDAGEVIRLFEKLMTTHPDYLPTYYPYAQLLIERKELKEAERVFLKGMATAKMQNDLKTYRELQSAYNDWREL